MTLHIPTKNISASRKLSDKTTYEPYEDLEIHNVVKESIKVLEECAEIQRKKGSDYQNPNSNIKQAMHYRRGIDSIHDIIQSKLYRVQSLLEAETNTPNYESIEDSYKDAINYMSFAVEYLRGKMQGQDPNRDIFNRSSK